MNEQVSLFERIVLAFVAFFGVLFDRPFAVGVRALRAGTAPAPAPVADRPSVPAAAAADDSGGLHLLAVLQREGRLIDFVREDVAGYSDAEIGAAARVVHQGLRVAFERVLELEPVLGQPDGATVEVPPGFDARAIRLTGTVVGNPPFKGVLKHHGWRAKSLKVPRPTGGDAAILALAEVELS